MLVPALRNTVVGLRAGLRACERSVSNPLSTLPMQMHSGMSRQHYSPTVAGAAPDWPGGELVSRLIARPETRDTCSEPALYPAHPGGSSLPARAVAPPAQAFAAARPIRRLCHSATRKRRAGVSMVR